jgi:hypothetical protein
MINILVVLVFGALVVSALDSVTDRAALVDLYQSTDGFQWRNSSNWLSPSASMCAWFGVECNANCTLTAECRVIKVQLNRNGLQGTIPASLGNMANLTGKTLLLRLVAAATKHGLTTTRDTHSF